MVNEHPCSDCGVMFEPEHRMQGRCVVCDEKFREELARADEAERQAELTRTWSKQAWPLYEKTKIERLPEPLRNLATNWTPNDDGIGIGIVGPSGKMKTRCLYLVARRLHFAGASVLVTNGISIARASGEIFSDDDSTRNKAADLLDDAKRSDVLLLDEVGKERLTERAAMCLFDIVESRNAHLRPILWTSNLGPDDLIRVMGERGEPLVRRLREFSQFVKL